MRDICLAWFFNLLTELQVVKQFLSAQNSFMLWVVVVQLEEFKSFYRKSGYLYNISNISPLTSARDEYFIAVGGSVTHAVEAGFQLRCVMQLSNLKERKLKHKRIRVSFMLVVLYCALRNPVWCVCKCPH